MVYIRDCKRYIDKDLRFYTTQFVQTHNKCKNLISVHTVHIIRVLKSIM